MAKLMTLDEAIKHCQEKACGSSLCARDHKQLALWLIELKQRRNGTYGKKIDLKDLKGFNSSDFPTHSEEWYILKARERQSHTTLNDCGTCTDETCEECRSFMAHNPQY